LRTPEWRNADYPWHQFDPESYLTDNYLTFRDDDRRTLECLRDFFVDALGDDPCRTGRRGIDVGTGTNLYPALAMLPFCDRITLYEYSRANIDWLAKQRAADWPSWNTVWANFWLVLSEHRVYADLTPHPHIELARCVDIMPGNVFDLRSYPERYDLGTMFFVAESITSWQPEFAEALHQFLHVLHPGAPFAVAFMERSLGYEVGGKLFPATSVDPGDVRRYLAGRAFDVVTHHIGLGENPLRTGYSGMFLVCGRAGRGTEFSAWGWPG
jgi:hypothetical protein